MPYKNICVSLDGSENEKRVVEEAVRLAALCQAQLFVVHVNDPAAGKAHLMMGSLPKRTEEDLRNLLRSFGFNKEADTVEVVVLEGENYPKEIAKSAKDADLLVIGHHPKNPLLAVLTDSVDERVGELVSCPMLVVPCI